MFRVKRPELIAQIWDLSQTGSVLITGSPGVGKSWAIAQFIRQCRAESRPMLPLMAQDFDIKSVDELTSALGFETDVLDFLKSLGGNPVLIIDGLDALRGEPSQRAFRELICWVARRLPQCAIVASIRTFDLQQSEALQQLFSFTFSDGSGRTFTEVRVTPFTKDHISEALSQVPQLELLLRNSSPGFADLLSNPFNLHLAVQLLQGGTSTEELSVVQSQVQLLDKYWRFRVERPEDGLDRKALLRKILQVMIERRVLSVSEDDAHVERAGRCLLTLQSDEVLRQSVTGRVSFYHNILFDYSSARLLLDEEVVLSFVTQDPSRTIFFRPTLSYFFHHVWLKDRQLFWRLAFSFLGSRELPERAKIVPAVTVYEAAVIEDDVLPLTTGTSAAAISGIAALLRAVQALGGLQSPHRPLWVSVLAKLADRPELVFVNELVALLNIASETAAPIEEAGIGQAARKLLRWMWGLAHTIETQLASELADMGAARVLPVVVKYFAHDPLSTKQLIFDIVGRFGSPVSGPSEAFRLAHEIEAIIKNDPALATDIYRRTFAYKEVSQEPTSIGGSVVMRLISTRQQDFSLALYTLGTAFNTFLERAPIEAAKAAAQCVDAEIEAKHPYGAREEIEEFRFQYAGHDVAYRSDFSEIWDSGARDMESLKLLDSALNYAVKRLSEPNDAEDGRRIVREIAFTSASAVVWKRLIEVSITHCAALYDETKALLAIPELISAPETTIAAGNLIAKAYQLQLVEETEAIAIEGAISRIPTAHVILRYEKPESIRNRLLLCIPRDEIRSDKLKELARELSEADEIRKNEPYVRFSSFARSFAMEDWLREEGVEVSRPENAEILNKIKPLQAFEHKHLNSTPSIEECAEIEHDLRGVEKALSERNPAKALREQATGVLCGTAECVLKNADLSYQSPIVQLCRRIVLVGAKDPSPEFDPKYHLPFDMPSWGGPSPRIEAAQGLIHIVWNWGTDSEVAAAVELLSRDEVPAVRFQIAAGLLSFYKHDAKGKFWSLAEEMLNAETTTGVMTALVSTVGRIAGSEPHKVVSLLSSAIRRGLPATERHELTHALLQIFVGLFVVQDDAEANAELQRFETDSIKFKKELGEEILAASFYLTPYNAEAIEVRERARALLRRVIVSVYTGLKTITGGQAVKAPSSAGPDSLSLLDDIALRIYLALDVNAQLRSNSPGLNDPERKTLYFELKPLLELLTIRAEFPGRHYLAPRTAHNLMETFNAVLGFDPAAVITYASAVCRASSALSYQFDPMAIGEMVSLVERALADYKDVLRDPAIANSLGDMLDIFVRAGWPQAMQLTFRLDNVIR